MPVNTERLLAIQNVPDFWERLSAAPARFLGLDYDGTLAPFHVDPMQARPLEGILELLRTLLALNTTTVAIVSGRPAKEVSKLLDHLPVTIIGSHGFELWRPTAAPTVILPAPKQRIGLDLASETARQLGYGGKLEYKVASIALHTRGLPPQLAKTMEEGILGLWSDIAFSHALECRRFNGGVEIRCQGRHKGDALAELLRAEPPGTFPVYVGDDETDEDAFRVIRDLGIGIKVGPASSSTAAQGFLADCQAVKHFLETWVSVTSAPRS